MPSNITQEPGLLENQQMVDDVFANSVLDLSALLPPTDRSWNHNPYRLVSSGETENEIYLASLTTPKLIIKEPIKVQLSEDAGRIVADSPELEVYGVGDELNKAIFELQITIEELYYSLSEDRQNLGPHMVDILNTLERKISAE